MYEHTRGGVVVTLPDEWAVIELGDDDARTADAQALLTERLGENPRWADLCTDVTRALLDSSAAAAAAHGAREALVELFDAIVRTVRVPG